MATTKNIQAIMRAFSIMELFQQTGNSEMSVKQIADGLDLNKSTAFGLINTLANLGCLQKNPHNQKYLLGLKLLDLANTVRLQNIIILSAHPYLERLNGIYGETVHCAMRSGDTVIYVDKVEASSIHISTQIGSQNDLHCTGVGKCVLAYLPDSTQRRLLEKNLRPMTANTITNADQLRQELQRVRSQGYAMDNEEFSIGLTCAAVPVFSSAETVACAISVSGMTARIQIALENGLIDELKRTSAGISKDTFGYEPAAV